MENQDFQFLSSWVHQILDQVDDQLPQEAKTALLRGCAQAHYQWANMDQVIAPYRGNLAGFLTFLNGTWGWKVNYDAGRGIITADENKSECVCPLVRGGAVKNQPLLCSCSEGFAVRMFGGVTGKPVQARVLRSIMKGDPSCVYEVQILPDDL
jgi:hypothetical protein